MEGQPNRDIEFEYYDGPDAPMVDRRRTQFQVPSNPVLRPYKCQECPRSFDRPSSLAQVSGKWIAEHVAEPNILPPSTSFRILARDVSDKPGILYFSSRS
jgi:hypothetical protein